MNEATRLKRDMRKLKEYLKTSVQVLGCYFFLYFGSFKYSRLLRLNAARECDTIFSRVGPTQFLGFKIFLFAQKLPLLKIILLVGAEN